MGIQQCCIKEGDKWNAAFLTIQTHSNVLWSYEFPSYIPISNGYNIHERNR